MDYQEARRKFHEEREWVRKGNAKGLQRQRDRGKRHVSERIAALVDEGSWLEYGEFGRSAQPGFQNRSQRDGVMTGLGRIAGRSVVVIADDATILGATQSFVSVRKVDRMIELAVSNGFPIISLSDGGGVRMPDGIGVGFTRLCGLSPVKSLSWLANRARRPLFICAALGYCYGDPAFRAGMADITVMVPDSAIAVSAPMVLETAISEKISDRALGGCEIHETITGTVDIVVPSEEECFETIRGVLTLLRPPEASTDPMDRLVDDLEKIIPDNNRLVYDMRKVVDRICDHGEWTELKRRFGKGLLVGLGRIGGRAVGIMASQPLVAGGSVDAKGLRKSAAFLNFIERLQIPLVVLQDIPGFLIGSAVEKDAMIEAIAQHSGALDAVTVPMITIILRKAYGAAYYFLGMGATGARFVAAWPNAEISFMAPDIGAAVVNKHVAEAERLDAIRQTTQEFTRSASIWDSASECWIDSVILPEETRKTLCHALSYFAGNRVNQQKNCEPVFFS